MESWVPKLHQGHFKMFHADHKPRQTNTAMDDKDREVQGDARKEMKKDI